MMDSTLQGHPYCLIGIRGLEAVQRQVDIYGNEIEDREYNSMDFDWNPIIDERTQAVANRINKWLKANDRYNKTALTLSMQSG